MQSDVSATTHKERKMPKKLSHLEVHQGKNGGHIVKHIHTNYEHPPEEHIFGKEEGGAMLAHVGKMMGVASAEPEEEGETNT